MSSRILVVSSDCPAGLPPERDSEHLDPAFRERFKTSLAAGIA